jgi:hypothetical protein
MPNVLIFSALRRICRSSVSSPRGNGSFYDRAAKRRIDYKINRSQEFVIGGYTLGDSFDALVVGVYGGLLRVSKAVEYIGFAGR